MAGLAVNYRHRWALLAIILLAFALRTWLLGQPELWFDEALSAVIASKAWHEIVAYTQNAPFEHPPTYYLALRAWTLAAGNSEVALRFFSVFWGVLLIPLTYRFMTPWGGRRLALLTALVASLSVTFVEHAREVRMYALMPVLGVAVLYFFFRALEERKARWWLLFCLVTVLGVSIHVYFSLLLLVPLAILLLGGRRTHRALLTYAGILATAAAVAGIWLWLSPGPRQAVLLTLGGEGPSTSTLAQRLHFTTEAAFLRQPSAGHLFLGLVAVLGAVLCPLPPPRRSHPVNWIGSRTFLLVWLLVPWLVALAIPYWLQGRHLAYLWPALYGLMACGLLALRRWGWLPFAAGLLLLFLTSSLGLSSRDWGGDNAFQFGSIMHYIEDRAETDDLLIMTQPSLWPLADYYSQGELDTAFVPDSIEAAEGKTGVKRLDPLVEGRARVWLGPVGTWTADSEGLVELWLSRNGYPAYKEWFPGSGSASLFYLGGALEPLAIESDAEWEGGLRLLDASRAQGGGAEGADLIPGEGALLLSLTWQATGTVETPHLVSVALVDDQSQIWAERQSEPCGGQCPVDGWAPGWHMVDRHAVEVPLGTPPGDYRLQVGWYAPGEGRLLPLAGGGQRLDLGEVRVARPEAVAEDASPDWSLPNPMLAEFAGGIAVLGFDVPGRESPSGGTLALDLYWRALAVPQQDYALRLELVGPGDDLAASWERPPVADFLPTSLWLTGDYFRVPHRLSLPAQLAAGPYRLRLRLVDGKGQPLPLSGWRTRDGLSRLLGSRAPLKGDYLDLGTLTVQVPPERERTFEVPDMAHSLNLKLDQGVELLGYDLGTRAAVPGDKLPLTLYWRAGGPTDLPYKVFAHLGDGGGPPPAQHDGPPGQGCCPTDTWVVGEVVADRHVIPLGASLSPGSYALTVGMYDQESGLRLPVYDTQGVALEGGQVLIGEVVVKPPSTPEPQAAPQARPEMPYRAYLPLAVVGW